MDAILPVAEGGMRLIAEPVVDPKLDEMNLLADVERVQKTVESGYGRSHHREQLGLGAQIHEIVFDLCGPVSGRGVSGCRKVPGITTPLNYRLQFRVVHRKRKVSSINFSDTGAVAQHAV